MGFDRLPPRARTAHGSWVLNSNPFLTIGYASRSWHVSKSHYSFSLLAMVPFSPMKRKRIWIRDASPLSEMVAWLSGIPEGIIHQKLLCHLPQQKAEAQVPSIPQPFISLFTTTFCVSCARLQPHLSTCTYAVCSNHQRALKIASAIAIFPNSWYSAIFISSPYNV